MRWVAAILREESGAAISASEYLTKGSIFFPRTGDDQAEIDRKTAARAVEEKALFGKLGASGQRQIGENGFQVPVEEDPDELEYNSLAIVNDIDYQDAQSYYGTPTTTSPVRGFSSGIGSASPFKQ